MDAEEILRRAGAKNGKPETKRRPGPQRQADPPPPAVDDSYTPQTIALTDTTPFPTDPLPEAFHGLAGELVKTIDKQTESSRVAVLVQTLVAFGNVVGAGPHFRVENTKHNLNLFTVIVGQSAVARKGTSWRRVLEIFETIDKPWLDDRVKSGMSSGEGLLWEVRDAVFKEERDEGTEGEVVFKKVQTDQGIADKRLLVQESEFAAALKQADRSGNILSVVLRLAWDSGNIQTMTKNTPVKSTGAHVSVIGHITNEELRRFLSNTDVFNGFGNRFLWVAVRRSKLLPMGGLPIDMSTLTKKFAEAVSFARVIEQIPLDDAAADLWIKKYPHLTRDRFGLVGALLGRADPQTMRLACLYALLDLSYCIRKEHLNAALALWDYCERSTSFIFGKSTGDTVADDILSEIRKFPDGLSRNDIFDSLSRHQTKERVERALMVLEMMQLAEKRIVATRGRPKEMWFSKSAR